MKKAKAILWLVIAAFIALVIYQNKGFFLTRHSFQIDLLFAGYQSPEVPSALLFLLFFVLGLLIAYFFSLVEKYKAAKTIKSLMAANSAHEKTIETLKQELQGFKPQALAEPTAGTGEVDNATPPSGVETNQPEPNA